MSVRGVGYGNTAASFAVPISNKILLGAKVTKVNYKNTNNLIVSFIKNGVAQTVTAKTVLVTVSLGVLKARSILFTPSLPRWKQNSIDKMGFGIMNKCIMQWYDEGDVVWPDKEWIELITPNDGNSGKWTTFFNPTKYKGVPTLVGWVGGRSAKDMETQTDAEVLDDVMRNLEAMFPTIKQPDRVIVTRWGQEENFLGTYTYKTVGRGELDIWTCLTDIIFSFEVLGHFLNPCRMFATSYTIDIDFGWDAWKLQKSVGKLRFAGEATAGSSWYGTTVGAWNTGEEAAQEMAKDLSRRRGASAAISPEPATFTTITIQLSSSAGALGRSAVSSATFTLLGIFWCLS